MQQADPLIEQLESLLEETAEAPDVPSDEAAFTHRASQYAQLSLLKRRLETSLKEVGRRMLAIEPQLQLDMAASGMDNCKIGGVTIFQRTETWVRKKPEKDGITNEMVCDALRKIGRGDMVADGYSASSLKSYVLEMVANEEPIPPELGSLLDIGSRKALSTLKG